MSKQQGRRCKIIPKMVDSKIKERTTIKNQPKEPVINSNITKNKSEMYVCSPDIWKKFGIKINLEQSSKISTIENITPDTPKLDTVKIKQSLNSKILAKKASQTLEKNTSEILEKTPERPNILKNEIESPSSFLAIDPRTNNFVISDEYVEASDSKRLNSNSDVTTELLKLNESKGDQIMEELVNSIIAENCNNPQSKDIIDTIIIPLDNAINLDNPTAVLNLIETNSTESIPIDTNITFNNLSLLNISDDVTSTDNLTLSTQITDTITPNILSTPVPEVHQEVIKVNSENISNSELILCSDVMALCNQSDLSVISDIIPPEIIESDIMMVKLDLSITNDNSLLKDTVNEVLQSESISDLTENNNVNKEPGVLPLNVDLCNTNLAINEDLTQNIDINEEPVLPSNINQLENVTTVTSNIDINDEITDDEPPKENVNDVSKIVEYLKQFFNKSNNTPQHRNSNVTNQLNDDNHKVSNHKNDLDNIGVEEPGGFETEEKEIINDNSRFSKVYKKQKSKLKNDIIQKFSSDSFEEVVTTLVIEKNIDRNCYGLNLDTTSYDYWFGQIRTEMFDDIDDVIDNSTNGFLEIDDENMMLNRSDEEMQDFDTANSDHSNIDEDQTEDMFEEEESESVLQTELNSNNVVLESQTDFESEKSTDLKQDEEKNNYVTLEPLYCDETNLSSIDSQSNCEKVNTDETILKNVCNAEETVVQVECTRKDLQNNLNDSNTIQKEVEVIKSKRGRKKKCSTIQNNTTDDLNKTIIDNPKDSITDVQFYDKELAEQEPIKIPKKRGRKKKCETIQFNELNVSLNDHQDKGENASIALEKSLIEVIYDDQIKVLKKRGRKKKCETMQIECNEYDVTSELEKSVIDSTLEEQIKVPKKRGRKKKCIEQIECSESNVSLNDLTEKVGSGLEKSVIDSTHEEQIKVPKKRGRKKKCIEQTECNESNVSLNDLTETVSSEMEKSIIDSTYEEQIKVPKKRGRKKKCIEQMECNESNVSLNDLTENMSSELEKSLIDSTHEEQIKVPKKRGRKKKCVVDEVNSEINLTVDNSENNVADLELDKSGSDLKQDDQILTPRKGGRKRMHDDIVEVVPNKRIRTKKQEQDFIPNDDLSSDTMSEISDDDEPKKRRKRRSKQDVSEDIFSIASLYNQNGALKPFKKGRKAIDDELLNIKATKALLKDNTMRTCVLCSKNVHLKNWPEHNLTHHDLMGWLEGDEPIDNENFKLVSVLLQKVMKVKKKLVCKKCNESRSSAVGFLHHLNTCQMSEESIEKLKIVCNICNKRVFQQSFKSHMNGHKEQSTDQEEEQDYSKRSKRKAAEVAEQSFKDIQSEPQEDNRKLNKYFKQTFKLGEKEDNSISKNDGEDPDTEKKKLKFDQVYICLICSTEIECKKLMMEHLKKDHSEEEKEAKFPTEADDCSFVESDEESDGIEFEDIEFSKRKVKNEKSKMKSKREKRNYSQKNQEDPMFNFVDNALYNTREFHERCGTEFVNENFSEESLFMNLKCKTYEAVAQDEANSYLPESRQSCNMAHNIYKKNKKKVNDISWKKYNLFESDLNNDNITMWCGGTVGSLSWSPGYRETQFLAVSASRSFDERYFANEKYQFASLLQIWNIGKLSNDIGKCCSPASMVYGITHEHGVVWDMDWCPSGCDDDCNNSDNDSNNLVRMGLLATACSDANVYIYAVPHPNSLPECESKIYKTTPSMVLRLEYADISKNIFGTNYQAVKIFWTRNKGHNIIAVGYSNGMIALFDITLKSMLLRQECDEIITYLPYFSFQPYTSPINGLVIIPMNYIENENEVYLGISSLKGSGIWKKSIPLSNISGHYTNLFLSYPWPSVVALMGKINPRNVSSMLCLIMARSSAKQMHYQSSLFAGGGIGDTSFFHNAILAVNDLGDVEVWPIYFPVLKWHKRLLTNNFKQPNKSRLKKAVLAMSELKGINNDKLDGEDHSDLLSYESLTQKLGLVFVDIPHLSEYNPMSKRNVNDPVPTLFALQKSTCAKFNPSLEASRFYAVGGRAGQVRIMCITHLTDDNYSETKFNQMETYF